MRTQAFLLVTALALPACREREQAPDPPDVSDLVQAYSAPDGQLDPSTAPALVEGVAQTLRDLERLRGLLDLVAAALPAVGATETGEQRDGLGTEHAALAGSGPARDGLGAARSALTARGDFWARITQLCGLTEDDGDVVLHNVFDGGEPGEVVWGVVDACILRGDDVVHRLDGDLRAHAPELGRLGVALAFDGLWAEGDAAPEPLVADVKLDLETRALYVRREIAGARFLVGVGLDGGDGSPLQVVDRAGTWRCLLGQGARGGRCEREGAEVSW